MRQNYCYRAGDILMSPVMNDIHALVKSVRYKVRRDFVDFYKNQFTQGEILTFVEYHFLPYHGGYTIIFKEKQLYLQELENADILECLGDYLIPVLE
jgi:hypothetical protein